jgi:transcription initiation factor IIE alpha subunit
MGLKSKIRILLSKESLTFDQLKDRLNVTSGELNEVLSRLERKKVIDITKKGKYWNCEDFFD